MIKLLEELCLKSGASSNEVEVREYIKGFVKNKADEIHEDTMGNLYVFKKGKKRRKAPLMVCAHMDEIGLIVTDITEDGYLKFDFVGGVDRRVCIGKRVLVGKKKIPGIIGFKAVHLTTAKERESVPPLTSLCIDIGCTKKSKAEKYISRGDTAVFDSSFEKLGENRIKARAIDDRIGCAVMLKLISEDIAFDTHFVFTVQEESGCRGATVAAYSVKPDTALVLEGTTAADIPSSEGAMKVCSLGKGAVLGYMDGGAVYDKELFSLLRDIAEKKNIPWQMKSRIAGGTDASRIIVSQSGVKTTSISLPTRYIHSPSCVGDIRDMEAMLSIAREFINCEEVAKNA